MTPDADLPMEVRQWERDETTGWRVRMPAGVDISARGALVKDLDGPWLGELTVRGQAGWRYFSTGVEVTGAMGTSELWDDLAFGNVKLDLHFLVGKKTTHAIGVKGTIPTGDATWWATMPSSTIAAAGAAISYVGATDRWVWQIHTGFLMGQAHRAMFIGQPDVGVAVATVQPIGAGFSVVGETEIMFDMYTPIHLRALARYQPIPSLRVDLGLAVDNTVFFDPSVQAVFALGHQW